MRTARLFPSLPGTVALVVSAALCGACAAPAPTVAPADLVTTIITPMVKLYGDRFGGLTGWQFSTLTPQHRYWNKQIAPSMGIGKKDKP